MDTAESIGHSIKLFDADTEIYKIKGNNVNEIVKRLEEIEENITKAQKELSDFNINDEMGEKINVDKKVENLKLKVKSRIENIYEDANEEKPNDNNNNNDNNKIGKENGENNLKDESKIYRKMKQTNRIENGNNFVKEDDISEERLLQKNKIENFVEENEQERNYIRKKDSIPNMSIFKFMVDNQYFVNSDIDLENYTLIKGKVLNPEFSISDKKSESNLSNGSNKKMLEIDINGINNGKEENIQNTINEEDNDDNNISFKEKFDENKKKINRNINKKIIKNKTETILNEEVEINNLEEKQKRNINELAYNLQVKDDNNNKKNINININNDKEREENKSKKNNSSRNLTDLRKIQRKKINLPTKASSFLEYFGECLEKAKDSFNIQQKALTLFKIPYLYYVSEKDIIDTINKDSKKAKKLKVKNYLLHTKIKYSLIIQGDSISYCTSEGKAGDLFWILIQHSRSVICCRCSPIQKSEIVNFVKRKTKDLTLSIGDGENDVNMIKTAHIGIGIYGKEGSQAAYNSDYAFYEFKYLKRLLFANGRFILLRNSYLYNLFFSKNFVYTLQYLLFNFFTLYSGTFLFDEFYDSMFNTFVSIVPLVTYSVLEEDIDIDFIKNSKKEKIMMTYLLPDMYKQARDIKPLNVIRYCVITFLSLIMAIIFLGFFSISFKGMIKNSEGQVATFYELIFYLYFAIVATHFFMVYIDTSLFNYLVIIFFVAQMLADILFVIIMNSIDNDFQLSNVVGEVTNSPICFLASIGICGFICVCFYILRRAELFFGLNLVNLIKINKIEDIYIGKYYKKKINQMIRAIRGIVKFKKIHKEMKRENKVNSNTEYENLVDIKMKKIVNDYENKKVKKNK